MEWRLADAKNRFSEVVRRALTEGPQRITRRRDAVIVLSEADYRRLAGTDPDIIEYIRHGPSFEGITIERDRSTMREL